MNNDEDIDTIVKALVESAGDYSETAGKHTGVALANSVGIFLKEMRRGREAMERIAKALESIDTHGINT